MAKQLTQAEKLQVEIQRLTNRRNDLYKDMKTDLFALRNNLKPAAIIKSTVHDLAHSSDFKDNLSKIVGGMFAGLFTKRLLVGTSTNFWRKTLGTLLEIGVADTVVRHGDGIKDWVRTAVNAIFTRRGKKAHT